MQAFVFGSCTSGSTKRSGLSSTGGLCLSTASSSFVVATAGSLKARFAHASSATSSRSNATGMDMKIRVAVVGGGPAGSCAAEVLAKSGVEVTLFERKMDNAKPCGGAIPLCMVGEFELPESIIDRKVRKMKMISPSNREVDIGRTLKPDEYIGMCRREVLDGYLRDRAVEFGTRPINGLVTEIELPKGNNEPYTVHYSDYESSKTGNENAKTMEFDVIIGADGANSRVAKAMDAGDYQFAIAFQERIKIPEDKMRYYEELAEMYVGDDVSPDFYAWVFPKYDHVAVGTGTVVDRPSIKKYQTAIRNRAAEKLAGGKILRIEAHPIPEHPRPRRVNGRMMLVGDAAGYVTKCSGEGIYFAAKSGRMCAESLLKITNNGETIPTEQAIKDSYIKDWDKKYWATYKVLDVLQSVFYTNNVAREAFVELCDDEYVQKVTFDSYLYKEVTKGSPVDDIKLLFRTAGAFLRGNAFAPVDVNKF